MALNSQIMFNSSIKANCTIVNLNHLSLFNCKVTIPY